MNRSLLAILVLTLLNVSTPSHGYTWYHASPEWCAKVVSDFKTGQLQEYVGTLDRDHLADLADTTGYCSPLHFDDAITHFIYQKLGEKNQEKFKPLMLMLQKANEGLPACDDQSTLDTLVSAVKNSPAGKIEGLELLDTDQVSDDTEKVIKAWSSNITPQVIEDLKHWRKRICTGIAILNSGKKAVSYQVEEIKGKIYVTNVKFGMELN